MKANFILLQLHFQSPVELIMQKKDSQNSFSFEEITRKAEGYCAYQERCHDEVIQKLKTITSNQSVIDSVIVHLIENNFLNEERFACSFG